MTSPATVPRAPASPANALTRVEQKLDRIEQRLAFLDQLPAVLEAGASTADDLARTHQLHERVESALHLVEKLTRPETLAKLEELIELANGLPDHVSTLLSTLDDVSTAAAKRGIDMASLVPDLAHLTGTALHAIQHAKQDRSEPGLWSLITALKDPAVSRAVGFGLAFARTVGKDLESPKPALPGASK